MSRRFSTPSRPATRRRPPGCCRWSTTNCAASPRKSSPRRSRDIRSKPPPWSTRPTCGSSAPTRPNRWDGRGHFFAAAADGHAPHPRRNARRKQRIIHGGGRQRQKLHPDLVAAPVPDDDLLALDAALARLAERDPVKARLVELRYFAGLTGDQAAQVLGISPKTADRYWVYARAWVRRDMEGGASQ